MGNYADYIEAVRAYLRGQKATDERNPKSMKTIVEAVKKQFEGKLAEGTLYTHLSNAAKKDNDSGIVSLGPHRGYWLNETALALGSALSTKLPEDTKSEEPTSEKRVKIRREEALYEPVKKWLTADGYRSENIADMRGGAKWSNPDVLGIRVSKNFGLTDIEIVSVEAKIAYANWRQNIFEAIAHKQFADRVYYCYPVTEGRDKLEEEIRRYSELYRVGILHLFLEEKIYESLYSSRSSAELPDLSESDVVIERIPAPYDFVPPRYQIEFLKSLDLRDEEALWMFGTEYDQTNE